MACWAFAFLAVAAVSQVSGGTIGKNPITCITFDKPLRDSFDDPIGSNGVFVNNFGVEITPEVGSSGPGVDGSGGEFKDKSKMQIPFLTGNDFSEFSVSIWFKRKNPGGVMPLITSNGCSTSGVPPTIAIESAGATSVKVTLSATIKGMAATVTTPTQNSFVHIVVTARMSRVNGWGWGKIYVNGKLQDKATSFLQGSLKGTFFPIAIGADACVPSNSFEGVMDSISFARYELKRKEVDQLYNKRGSCIGYP